MNPPPVCIKLPLITVVADSLMFDFCSIFIIFSVDYNYELLESEFINGLFVNIGANYARLLKLKYTLARVNWIVIKYLYIH